MKKYLLLFFLILLIQYQTSLAQSTDNWEPIGLTLTGNNIQQGVEAFYNIAECNGEYFVVIKFINHNDENVLLKWEDEVFTKNREWVQNIHENTQKSITLQSGSTILGDCTNQNDVLVIKIKDFVAEFSDFYKYRTNSLQITTLGD
jgi:hypothetical protein